MKNISQIGINYAIGILKASYISDEEIFYPKISYFIHFFLSLKVNSSYPLGPNFLAQAY